MRWALLRGTAQETIRLDPSLAGATITRDSTLNVARRVTIEGPANRSITLSGGGSRRVMYIAEGTHLKNLTITGGDDQVVGGGRRASAVMATRRAKGRVHLENSIIVGNGTPVSNCWYPAETFVRLGLNIADDLTCGDTTQMLIQDPRQPS